ncbi:hypothetical protein CG399_04985, partial [Bifidobacteriaceae bacterium NR015]
AETMQLCKETVGYAPKNGKNFTWARTEDADRSANRKCEQSTEPEEAAESLQLCKGKVAKEQKTAKLYTRANRRHRQKARNRKKRQKLRSRVKEKSGTREKTAESLRGHEQKAQTESASRKCGTGRSGRKFTAE